MRAVAQVRVEREQRLGNLLVSFCFLPTQALREHASKILEANGKDLAAAETNHVEPALVQRLKVEIRLLSVLSDLSWRSHHSTLVLRCLRSQVTEAKIETLATGIEQLAMMPEPVRHKDVTAHSDY